MEQERTSVYCLRHRINETTPTFDTISHVLMPVDRWEITVNYSANKWIYADVKHIIYRYTINNRILAYVRDGELDFQ